jgi:hypothetical protein
MIYVFDGSVQSRMHEMLVEVWELMAKRIKNRRIRCLKKLDDCIFIWFVLAY